MPNYHESMGGALKALSIVTAALSLWLLASGLYLFFFYVPTAAMAWTDVSAVNSGEVWASRLMQDSHRVAAALLTIALLVWAGVLVSQLNFRRASWIASTLVLTIGALFSGIVLPWDQLALQAVTVGKNVSGYLPTLSGEQVEFVLIDGQVISNNEIALYLIGHTVVGVVILALVSVRSNHLFRNDGYQSK